MSTVGSTSDFGGSWQPPVAGRREMPQLLRVSRVLVHLLFAVTVLGGVGLLLTAASVDALDGTLLALALYGAAPGVTGWVLARRAWTGGVWVWRGLVGVQAWLLLGAFSSLRDGSLRGFTQMFLPLVILLFLSRAESRQWFRLDVREREVHEPPHFSLSRMITWRRDRGQSTVEYVGLLTLVVAIILALLLSGVGGQVADGFRSAVCAVTGSACPGTGDGTEVAEAGGDAADGGTDGGTTGGGESGGAGRSGGESGGAGTSGGGADTGGSSSGGLGGGAAGGGGGGGVFF
ncbi:MAG TPA: hypothetical protein DD420_12420, partial [Streptomyces sp.]|nr:hypothetical protein [Streptomyces sp.]